MLEKSRDLYEAKMHHLSLVLDSWDLKYLAHFVIADNTAESCWRSDNPYSLYSFAESLFHH